MYVSFASIAETNAATVPSNKLLRSSECLRSISIRFKFEIASEAISASALQNSISSLEDLPEDLPSRLSR